MKKMSGSIYVICGFLKEILRNSISATLYILNGEEEDAQLPGDFKNGLG